MNKRFEDLLHKACLAICLVVELRVQYFINKVNTCLHNKISCFISCLRHVSMLNQTVNSLFKIHKGGEFWGLLTRLVSFLSFNNPEEKT